MKWLMWSRRLLTWSRQLTWSMRLLRRMTMRKRVRRMRVQDRGEASNRSIIG
jgi:hypothetical protein